MELILNLNHSYSLNVSAFFPRDLPDHASDQGSWRQRVHPVRSAWWGSAERRGERPQNYPLERRPGTWERVWGEPQLNMYSILNTWTRWHLRKYNLCVCMFRQIPEKYGAVRTLADVGGEELLVGTTRNAILRGTFSDGFVDIVQVRVRLIITGDVICLLLL